MKLPPKSWRSYSTVNRVLSAKAVRNRFLDYFVCENGHEFVKSSPVLPQFDSTIPFVNAGMCQFKRVFTGEDEIEYSRAANTQKCIRVGGKHNDLNVVGRDSFHHTFFEMLGNWSFGSYGKREACKFAWELLTKPPYSIPSHKLFVTYFGGDHKLNLPPDNEIKEIWLELGVRPERIVSFGVKENFWEMGLTGPCGTCTEIHVALTDDLCSRPDLVNRDNPLLAELWNIVFIKYNRTEETIEKLPREFIDTGMGFERLVTLLQGKHSNYDTDLFRPLFETIENKVTGAPKYAGTFNIDNLDVSYRCLADFSRMITVAVADNVFPGLNHKLRRVLRRALLIARCDFKQSSPERLLLELARNVVESLHETFPEIGRNFGLVEMIIEDEAMIVSSMISSQGDEWEAARKKYPVLQSFSFLEYPLLEGAYEFVKNELATSNGNSLPVEKVNSLFGTFGLDRPVVEKIASSLNVTIDWDELKLFQENEKIRIKKSLRTVAFETLLRDVGIQTDVSPRREFSRTDQGVYTFPDVEARILAIVQQNNIVSVAIEPERVSDELRPVWNVEVDIGDQQVGLILDRTNFNCRGRDGRRQDTGVVIVHGEVLKVNWIQRFATFVVHHVQKMKRSDTRLGAGVSVTLRLDAERRLSIMRNNLLSHLAYAALKKSFPLLYLEEDISDNDFVGMKMCVHEKHQDLADSSKNVVEFIQNCVEQKIPVETTFVSSEMQLLKLPGVSLRPGLVYPAKNIEVISVRDNLGNLIFKEPCTDIYALNTADLQKVRLMKFEKNAEFATLNVTIAAGTVAEQVMNLENRVLEQYQTCAEKIINASETVSPIVFKLTEEYSTKALWYSSDATLKAVQKLKDDFDEQVAKLPEELVIRHIRARFLAQASSEKFAVHFSTLNMKAFKFKAFVTDLVAFEHFPVLFFAFSHEKLKGICHVPDTFVTDKFNAEIWLKSAIDRVPWEPPFGVLNDVQYKNYSFLSARYISPEHVHGLYEGLAEAAPAAELVDLTITNGVEDEDDFEKNVLEVRLLLKLVKNGWVM